MSARLHDPDLDRLLLPPSEDVELSDTLRIKIINGLWNQRISPPGLSPYSAYFEYFGFECINWRASGEATAIQTYRDFLDLVQHLKNNRMEPRTSPKILAFFSRYPNCSEDSIRNSLDLAVSLWLMISVGSQNNKFLTGRSNVKWDETESLEHLIAASFPSPQPTDKQKRTEKQQWPKSFNACNLERIGGFDIAWTSNLADHLCFDQDLERIKLYHHACILQSNKNAPTPEYVYLQPFHPTCSKAIRGDFDSPEPNISLIYLPSQILPDGLLNETMLTLALLLPRTNGECRKWYEKARKRYPGTLDLEAGNQELGHQGRALEKYTYWNDRLSIIKQAYDESEPKNVSQWWVDRRKKVQWYTFWIAAVVLLLTVIFGLIQSITGILQVYAAYHPPQ